MTLGPLMVDLAGTALTRADRELLGHPLVGGVLLFTRNYVDPAQLRALTAQIQAVRSPPLLVAVDQEGGRVQRFRPGFSPLPPLRRMGQAFDLDAREGLAMARALGWLMASELLCCGIDLSFAPCVDLDFGVSEVIGDRAFHARGAVVAQLAVAYAHGMRDAGMAATAKHFPGHGAVVADSHRSLPVDRRELADLDADLAPYRALIGNGLAGVMAAHVQFPAVDPEPASFSRRWISGLLRTELRFGGAVFCDDLSMGAAAGAGALPQRAERALAAGCDMLPVCNDRPGVERLIDELKVGSAPASQLRLVRMRARQPPVPGSLAELQGAPEWRSARAWLARCAAAPELHFERNDRDPGGA